MRRRIAITLGLVTAIAAHQAPPAASQAAAPQPAAPQAAAPPSASSPALAFASEAGMILSPITPSQTAVFEDVMQKVREALEKSTDPVRRQQAAGWKVYKSADPFQGNTLYLSVMDPAVKGADYSVFDLLKDTMGDADARVLFEQFRGAYGGPMHVVNMAPFISMAPVEKPVDKK
jgi:hypothetical protein